jgi:hypothetical protein
MIKLKQMQRQQLKFRQQRIKLKQMQRQQLKFRLQKKTPIG